MPKQTRQELRETIAELEWENRLLVREGVAREHDIEQSRERIEQLQGQARLVALNHAEEIEELAAERAAEISMRTPHAAAQLVGETIEQSVRIRLEALDALAQMIEEHFAKHYMGGAASYTLVEQLHAIIESDKTRAQQGQRIIELTQIIGAVHDRTIGTARQGIKIEEQLRQIGDSAATSRRDLDDARTTIDRQAQQIVRQQSDIDRMVELAREISA